MTPDTFWRDFLFIFLGIAALGFAGIVIALCAIAHQTDDAIDELRKKHHEELINLLKKK